MKQAIIIILAVAFGAFLWWAFSPLLFDTVVQDELPDIRVSEPNITDTQSTQTTDEQTITTVTETNSEELPKSEQRFPISDTTGHPASGYVRVIQADGEQIIRYEDYDGTNGPDLKVYLAKDLEADDYVDLGPAKGNQGNINYGVPLDVNIDDYPYVLTWCEAFGVLFDYAEIN